MTTDATPTLDIIHMALERLGYTGEQFGAARLWPASYGVYRKSGAMVTVTWSADSTVYDVSAAPASAVPPLVEAFVYAGLTCAAGDNRIDEHGQEHIDAEVRKMLD